MGSTDFLGLSEHKIFREACESLPKKLTKTLNLLTVRDSVVFTWDFENNCVLTLNIKAARTRDGDNVTHQKLLPLGPPLFTPEFLTCNDSGSLLAVCGPCGILVLELPIRCPPYGAFDNNKEVVYCRSHSLDERLLACNEAIEVRQAKFHPGSVSDSHLLVLTSDNMLRLYQIENNEAASVGVYPVGETPMGNFPGSKTPFLECYGETAVDFDFGLPEIDDEVINYSIINDNKLSLVNAETQTDRIIPKNPPQKKDIQISKFKKLKWPVYILRGDSTIFSMDVSLSKKVKPFLQGPLPIQTSSFDCDQNDACSILCLNTNPQIICVALSNGTLCHSILLDIDEETKNEMYATAKTVTEVPSKELLAFENVELELGLIVNEEDFEEKKYKCPIFLHKDDSKVNRYFATHNAGVHSLNLACVDDLQDFVSGPEDVDVTSDVFNKASTAEYLVCTKTASSEKTNPVVGFSLYYEPTSLITLLADGNLVTLGIITALLPIKETKTMNTIDEVNSPLKTMLKEPFDHYIQSILRKASTQPILMLSSASDHTQEECYELLQRAAQVFREDYFKYYTKAREELEKRIQALQMLKKDQLKVIEGMNKEKQVLQERAENLAEKYEDIKDKQDEISKRCEKLLMLVARRREIPSDAEKEFLKEVNQTNEKLSSYHRVIDKVKEKLKYQQIQITNWKSQETKKILALNEMQETTIKNNLQDMTKKINDMVKDINEYKRHLNLK